MEDTVTIVPAPIRRHLITAKEHTYLMSDKRDLWDRAERSARLISLVAIPFVIAGGGWLIQARIHTSQVQREYVGIAISILTATDKVYPALYTWAVDVLASNSPTPIPDSVISQLKSGEIAISAVAPVSAPADSSRVYGETHADAWLIVLGTSRSATAADAKRRADQLQVRIGSIDPSMTAPFSTQVFQTQNNNYVVTYGQRWDRATALMFANRLRALGIVNDAFIQADPGWTIIAPL